MRSAKKGARKSCSWSEQVQVDPANKRATRGTRIEPRSAAPVRSGHVLLTRLRNFAKSLRLSSVSTSSLSLPLALFNGYKQLTKIRGDFKQLYEFKFMICLLRLVLHSNFIQRRFAA